ncbi:MAG: tyrosine-type recombinase/integrase [Sphingomonas sp.]|nr:tyrosine-type recombinase/integrase [Sphingomonas sp.]MBA3642105.1 tyrosine-type recombinase/integrase [Acidobacteriota bacterium]
MTAQSEVVRMSLYERVERDGLTIEQRNAVLRAEMRAYRDGLEHLSAQWQFRPAWAKVTDVDADLQVYEAIWGAFARTGVVDGVPSIAYADEHFGELTREQRAAARRLVGSADLRHILSRETAQRLEALGIEPNPTNMALATRLMLDARSKAARELRLGIDTVTGVTVPEIPSGWHTAPIIAEDHEVRPPPTDASRIPEKWRNASPVEAAELLIQSNPAMLEHRKDGKRAASQVGEQTLRQIRWAAVLLQKSMNPAGPAAGIRPFWTCTFDDIVTLDSWFDKLPVTCGKSPQDREPETTLQAIYERALNRIDKGELGADAIGLDGVTTNKHLRKIKQVYDLAREEIEVLPEIRFAKFMVPDLKDERDARDAYTVEQAIEIFSLPPWTGCAGTHDRLVPGSEVFHDSLYFVLLIVWYTGMRREEVCKLLVTDVQCDAGYWYISIRNSNAGRVKNANSVRLIALAEELIRLGFVQYVDAIRAAGHDAVFPELVAERDGTKKGDVFYRIWWIYIAPLLTGLKRGQALHAARHSFDTELKELEVFPEHREDALGHAGNHGEGRRYSKAARLKKLKKLVDQVPIVTAHLPKFPKIRLLPADQRKPRPVRRKML